jgi:hypothetical protein
LDDHRALVEIFAKLSGRHYNPPQPFPKNEMNLYAVLKNDTCAVPYAESPKSELILRPTTNRTRFKKPDSGKLGTWDFGLRTGTQVLGLSVRRKAASRGSRTESLDFVIPATAKR